MATTHYDVLDVGSDADATTIKAAYRQLSKRYHPDITGDTKGHFFVMLQLAYETLSDPKKRSEYDAQLGGESPSVADSSTEQGSGQFYRDETNGLNIPMPEVDWQSMEWFTKDYSDIKERIRTPHHGLLTPILAIPYILSMVLIFILTLSYSPLGIPLGSIPALMAIPLWIRYLRQNSSRYPFMVASILSLAWCIVGQFQRLTDISDLITTVAITAIVGLGGMISGEFAVRKWDRWTHIKINRGYPTITAKDIKNFAIWGTAGDLDDAIEKFGERNVALGGIGERFTADFAEQLLRIPGTRVFHGLKFPGSRNADVDHAVINGNKIVFIDSKMWVGGEYSWLQKGEILRVNGNSQTNIHSNFSKAAERYALELSEATVRSRILIHSSNGRPVVIDNSNMDVPYGSNISGTSMVNLDDFLIEIGEWFSSDNTGYINKGLINALITRLK